MLTNLDQPLFDGANATKRDLVDYLDAVSGELLDVRPTTAELAAPVVFSKLLAKGSPQVSRRLTQMMLASLQAPQGQPVDVSGKAASSAGDAA